MTLQELIDSARALLNEPLDATRTFPDNTSSFWTDTVLTTYHNLVQQDVQAELDQTFEEYFITQSYLGVSAGTAEYSLPSRFKKLRRLEDARDPVHPVEIYPVSINNRGHDYPRLNETATHEGAYYIRGNQVVLTDTPTFTGSAAIRMHFVAALADITAGSVSSELPIEAQRAVPWGVAVMCLHQQQSDPTFAKAEYEKLLSKIKTQAEDRQIQRPRRVVEQGRRVGDVY